MKDIKEPVTKHLIICLQNYSIDS